MHTRVLSFMYYRYLGTRVTHADSATARGSGPFNSRSSSVERIGWRSAIETWMACRIREWKRMRSRRSRRSHRYQSQALKAALKRPATLAARRSRQCASLSTPLPQFTRLFEAYRVAPVAGQQTRNDAFRTSFRLSIFVPLPRLSSSSFLFLSKRVT